MVTLHCPKVTSAVDKPIPFRHRGTLWKKVYPTGFMVISNNTVEEVKIFSAAHDFCTVRFTSWHGGTRLRKSRVFAPRGKGFEEYQTGSCGMDAAAETETGGVALTSPGAERQGDVWFTV